MKERKHNYLVGYVGEGQCVYGRLFEGEFHWAQPMTLAQSKRLLRGLHPTPKQKTTVYKLVPIKDK